MDTNNATETTQTNQETTVEQNTETGKTVEGPKVHWTQTPEGKTKLSQSIKTGYERRRKSVAAKKAWRVKKAAAKANGAGTHVETASDKRLTVIIAGPDARKALAELLSNAQYDNLDVSIRVSKV